MVIHMKRVSVNNKQSHIYCSEVTHAHHECFRTWSNVSPNTHLYSIHVPKLAADCQNLILLVALNAPSRNKQAIKPMTQKAAPINLHLALNVAASME